MNYIITMKAMDIITCFVFCKFTISITDLLSQFIVLLTLVT